MSWAMAGETITCLGWMMGWMKDERGKEIYERR